MIEYPRIYHVSYKNTTDYEPQSGWYCTYERKEDGASVIIYCGEHDNALDYLETLIDEGIE